MANTVDERIVEAKFDASDFEKGVNKTIKKLDELKKSLNLEDAGKNITEFAKETSEGVNKAESALQRLSDRFTTFKGMLKQQILSGLAQEFSNAVLSIERSIAGLVKSISSDQVGAGMNKYTEILNSVRTMTAAGIDQTRAYEAVKRLGDYSDQTSYSLSQMTSAMSKLVASGMEIEKAEKSVEGLANMAASAGVNIYDAQRAFVNFSQAYSSGTMRIQDWTSFESLNMGTQNVMKVFMQAAEEVGTLTKTVDKNGNEIYKTTNKVNKAVKAGKQVATSGFRDTLSYGWLDKKTMEQATAVLSYFEDLEANINDLTEEELAKFSTKAFQAAKEARSFADVMGTVKDVVATGWATSFEIIFGKLDKATEFFTWLSESRLAEAIYSIGEFRNAVLTAWGTDWAEGGIFRKRDENGNFGTGRDMLVDTLKNIDELIGSIHEGLEDLFPEEFNGYLRRTLSFPEILGKNLGYFTRDIRDASKRLLDFFTIEQEVTEDGETKQKRFLREDIAARIGKIGQGLASVIGVFNKLYKIITETFEKVFFKVQPIIGAIGDAIGTIMEPFTKLNADTGFFKDFTNAIDNFLIVLDPVLKLVPPVIEFLGELGAFFVDNAIAVAASNIEIISGALGLLIEMFGGTSAQKANDGVGVIEGWTNGIKEFGESCREGLTAIKEFFKALFDDIRTLLGIGEQTEGEDGGFFAKISNFFQTNEFIKNVKDWVSNAIKDAGDWLSKVPNKLKNIWNIIDEFLFGKKETTIKWDPKSKSLKLAQTRIKAGFSKWLDETVNSVAKWIASVPQIMVNLWKTINDFLFGKEVTTKVIDPVTGETKEITTRVKEGFSLWLDNTIQAVKDWFAGIPGAINSLWNTAIEFFFGKEVTVKEVNPDTGEESVTTTRVKEGFSKWLDDTKTYITDTFLPSVPEKFNAIWDAVISFLFGKEVEVKTVNPETGEEVVTTTRVKEGFSKWLDDIKTYIVGTFLPSIPEKAKAIWDAVIGFIFGKEVEVTTVNPETGEEVVTTTRVKEGFSKWLDDIKTYIVGTFLPSVPEKLKALWDGVIGFIFGKEVEVTTVNPETGEEVVTTTRVKEGFSKWLDDIKTYIVGTFLPSIPEKVKAIWDAVMDFIFGKEVEVTKVDPDTSEESTTVVRVTQGFSQWLADTIEVVKKWVKTIPEKVSSLWQSVLDAIFGKTDTTEGDQTGAEEESSTIVEQAKTIIQDLGEKIGAAFSELPTHIANGINFGTGLLTDLLEHVTGWFSNQNENKKAAKEAGTEAKGLMEMTAEEAAKQIEGEEEPSAFLTALISVGQTMGKLVTETIPGLLTEAWTYVSENAGGWWEAISGVLNLNGFNWDTIQQGASDIGNKIAEYIRGIPGIIRSAIGSIKELFSGNGGESLEDVKRQITAQYTDEAGNIVDSQALKLALKDAEIRFGKVADGFNLWDSIKEIGGSIKDAFVDLGPDILAGLQGAFEWLGEKLGDATNFLNTAHNEGRTLDEAVAEKMKDENGEDSPLWTAIQSIGQTIFDFITKTIPAFISSAVDEVKMQIPKLLSGLFNSGETGSQNAIEGLSRMFGLDQNASSDTNVAQQATEMIQGVTEEFEAAAKEEEKVYIRTSDALAKVKRELDYLHGYYGNEDTGHYFYNLDTYEGDTAYKQKEKELSDMLDYLNSIDQLTEAWVIDNGNGTYSRIEEGVEKKQEQGEGFLGAIQSLLTGFTDIVGKIGESDTLKVVAICAAVMYALNAISDTLSIADELEAPGYTAKWEAIKIAILGIVGILGWVTYLASDTSDAGIKRLEQVETTLGKIGDFVKSVAEIAKVITIASAVKSGLNLFGSGEEGISLFGGAISSLFTRLAELGLVAVGSDVVGKGVESLFDSLGEVFTMVGESIDSFMQYLTPAIGEMVSVANDIGTAIDVMGKMGTLISKFYSAIEMEVLAVQPPANADSDTGYGDVLGWVTGLKMLDPEYQEALDQRLGAILEMGTMMKRFAEAIKTFEGIDDAQKQIERMALITEPGGTFGRFVENMIQAIQNGLLHSNFANPDLENVAIGFDLLGEALSVFGSGISGLNEENVAGLSKTLDVLEKLATAFHDMGGERSTLGKAVLGDNSLSKFGKEIKSFGHNVKPFFDEISKLPGTDDKDAKRTQTAIDMVLQISQGLAKATESLAMLGGVDELSYLASHLTGVGTGFAEFINEINAALSGDIDMQRVQVIGTGVNAISNLAQGIGALGQAQLKEGQMSSLFDELMTTIRDNMTSGNNNLFSIGFAAGGNLDSGIGQGIRAGTAAITAAQELANAISGTFTVSWEMHSPSRLFALYGQYLDEGLANGILAYQSTPIDAASEMATEAVNNTTSILETIKDLAISDMDVTPTITPVVDLTNVDNASEYIDGLYHPGAIGLDLSGMNRNVQSAIPTNYQSTNNDINFAGMINDLRSQIAMLNGAIGTIGNMRMDGLQVVLDSGVLVGGIIDKVDSTLGRRGFYAGRE